MGYHLPALTATLTTVCVAWHSSRRGSRSLMRIRMVSCPRKSSAVSLRPCCHIRPCVPLPSAYLCACACACASVLMRSRSPVLLVFALSHVHLRTWVCVSLFLQEIADLFEQYRSPGGYMTIASLQRFLKRNQQESVGLEVCSNLVAKLANDARRAGVSDMEARDIEAGISIEMYVGSCGVLQR